MRAYAVVMLAGWGCTVGTLDDVPVDVCGDPIEVVAATGDTLFLHDERGEIIERQHAFSSGVLTFRTPACSNSVTLVAEYYASRSRYAMTLTDVAPGAHLDFTLGRYIWNEAQPPWAASVTVEATPFAADTYTGFGAPGCSFGSSGQGNCYEPPDAVLAIASTYGTAHWLAYSLERTRIDEMHHEHAIATVSDWRTDFTSTTVADAHPLLPNPRVDASLFVHLDGKIYVGAITTTVPGTLERIPQFGNAATIITVARATVAGDLSDDSDVVIDRFESPPSRYTPDFASVPTLDGVPAFEAPRTLSWSGRSDPADATRACALWNGPVISWCIITTPDKRTVTFPRLPEVFEPTTAPLATSAMTMDTSFARSYADVQRAPFSTLAVPFSGEAEVQLRASRRGSAAQVWWSY